MAAALIAVEDVLIESDAIRGKHPISEAMRFVGVLNGAYRVFLSSTDSNRERLEYLLQINGIIQGRTYDTLLVRDVEWKDLDEPELRAEHFKQVRLNSGISALFVGANPAACARAMYMGATVLLWQRAQYARPEFRPDRPRPAAWQELEAEAERQVFLKRQDERATVEHEESEFTL